MQKIFALLAVSAALAAVAAAQKIEDPFRAEVGLYVPTFSAGSSNLGVNVGLGYSFYRRHNLDLAAEARGDFFHTDQDDGFGGRVGGDVSLGAYGVDARYRLGNRLFAGVGLAAAESHLDFDGYTGDTTKLGYSVEAGYDLTKSLYGLVRYQDVVANDIAAYRGLTVGVGVRF